METVAIGVREPDALCAALADAVRPLERVGARVRMEERRLGGVRFVRCRLEAEGGPAGASVAFRRALAGALAAWIVERDERRLLRRLIAIRYAYLTEVEREGVLSHAERALAGGSEAPGAGAPPAPDGPPSSSSARERQERVRVELLEYLLRHDTLVLDGFVRFRLKDYVEELAIAVDRAVDEFLLEREYREFIGLLRYFVNSRADRPPLAECFVAADGTFTLEDEAGGALCARGLDGKEAGAGPAGVAPEDLLVSALITVAPWRVRLHLPAGYGPGFSPEAMGSLREVFAGAVEVCLGCRRCPRRGGQGGDRPPGPPPPERAAWAKGVSR